MTVFSGWQVNLPCRGDFGSEILTKYSWPATSGRCSLWESFKEIFRHFFIFWFIRRWEKTLRQFGYFHANKCGNRNNGLVTTELNLRGCKVMFWMMLQFEVIASWSFFDCRRDFVYECHKLGSNVLNRWELSFWSCVGLSIRCSKIGIWIQINGWSPDAFHDKKPCPNKKPASIIACEANKFVINVSVWKISFQFPVWFLC